MTDSLNPIDFDYSSKLDELGQTAIDMGIDFVKEHNRRIDERQRAMTENRKAGSPNARMSGNPNSNQQVREALQAALAYLPASHWEGDHYGGYTVPAGEALLVARSKVLAALEILPGETKPARDAEHCDFPDCEKHNTLVVERLRYALQKIVARYDGFTSAKEMMQWARAALEILPGETTEPCRQCGARAPSYCSNCGIAIEPLKLPSGGSNG